MPLGCPTRLADAVTAVLALVIVTSVSMVFGELVPKYLAVARPLPTARAVVAAQLLFSLLLTPAIRLTNGAANWILRRLGIEPAEELRSARSPQELVSLVRRLGAQRLAGPRHRVADRRSLQFGTLTAEELMTPRSKIVTLADRQHRRRPDRGGRRVRVTPAFRSSTATSTRPSASCTSSRCSQIPPADARTHAAHLGGEAGPEWCRRRWTAMR